jgi:AAA15 family ATPase/GTPase
MNEYFLAAAGRFRRDFICDKHQKNNDQYQTYSNLSNSISSPKVIHFSISLSHHTVTSKNTIPSKISAVKMAKSKMFLGKDTFGPIKTTPNHAAEMLIDNPENARSQGFVNKLSIENTLLSNSSTVNGWGVLKDAY